ncbi:hypothetical protein HaLaN_09853, partial [Haematococcus lacustris]
MVDHVGKQLETTFSNILMFLFADPREMTWLKLRAYHRAMNQYENHVAAVEGLEAKQRLQDYQVPTDLVPAQLLQLSPEDKPRAMEPRTIYTEAYLAEQALLRQWQQQSRQRTLAFWSGLGTVSGSYLLRWLWRKLVRKGKAAPKQS